MASIVFQDVSFAYDSSIDGLFSGIRFGLSEGWTGVIGGNGCGKTTILRLACRELLPRRGRVGAPPATLYCAQRTDEPLEQSRAFLESCDGESFRVRGLLGIQDDWLARWETLSHGERKRMQVATCLWLRPDLLAVDEPTNHLDSEARTRIEQALRSYAGIGLLVSHDRELLDGLCHHTLFVSPPGVELRSGGYTVCMRALRDEEQVAREERKRAQQVRQRLERELLERRDHARKAEKAKSLRGVDPKDHDARDKASLARVTDSGSGKSLRQLEGRLRQAAERESSIPAAPPRELGIRLHAVPSNRNAVVRIDAGRLALGPGRCLEFPDLIVQPQDRVALTGQNGGGKTTLIRHLVVGLTLPPERVLHIPQEISAKRSFELIEEVKRLPSEDLGRVMQWVIRLGSDPNRILGSLLPSPGEARKLLLAARVVYHPHLIIMDEPTNHMDLPSVECLESALRKTECALLLVSHDRRFLEALTTLEWAIAPVTPGSGILRLTKRGLRS